LVFPGFPDFSREFFPDILTEKKTKNLKNRKKPRKREKPGQKPEKREKNVKIENQKTKKPEIGKRKPDGKGKPPGSAGRGPRKKGGRHARRVAVEYAKPVPEKAAAFFRPARVLFRGPSGIGATSPIRDPERPGPGPRLRLERGSNGKKAGSERNGRVPRGYRGGFARVLRGFRVGKMKRVSWSVGRRGESERDSSTDVS
jgi:hypothetical protein